MTESLHILDDSEQCYLWYKMRRNSCNEIKRCRWIRLWDIIASIESAQTSPFRYDKGMKYNSAFSVPLFEISGAQVSLDAETSLMSINKVRMSAAINDAG